MDGRLFFYFLKTASRIAACAEHGGFCGWMCCYVSSLCRSHYRCWISRNRHLKVVQMSNSVISTCKSRCMMLTADRTYTWLLLEVVSEVWPLGSATKACGLFAQEVKQYTNLSPLTVVHRSTLKGLDF